MFSDYNQSCFLHEHLKYVLHRLNLVYFFHLFNIIEIVDLNASLRPASLQQKVVLMVMYNDKTEASFPPIDFTKLA